jgi:hypothetical protein
MYMFMFCYENAGHHNTRTDRLDNKSLKNVAKFKCLDDNEN